MREKYNPRTGVVEYCPKRNSTSIQLSHSNSTLKSLTASTSLALIDNKTAISFDDEDSCSTVEDSKKCKCLSVEDVTEIVSNIVANMLQSELKKLEKRMEMTPIYKTALKELEEENVRISHTPRKHKPKQEQ